MNSNHSDNGDKGNPVSLGYKVMKTECNIFCVYVLNKSCHAIQCHKGTKT